MRQKLEKTTKELGHALITMLTHIRNSYTISSDAARIQVNEALQTNPHQNIESCTGDDPQKIAALLVAFPWKEYVEYPSGLEYLWKALNATYCQDTLDTILQHAVWFGGDKKYWKSRRYAIAALVYANANPRKVSRLTTSLLSEAALQNDMQAVRFLCICGAIPQIKDLEVTSSLQIAQILVKYGAPVERADNLLHCCMFEQYSVALIPFYLSCGANPCIQAQDGYTALHVLISHHAPYIWENELEKAHALLEAAPQLSHIKNIQQQTPKEFLLSKCPDILKRPKWAGDRQLLTLLEEYEKKGKSNGVH